MTKKISLPVALLIALLSGPLAMAQNPGPPPDDGRPGAGQNNTSAPPDVLNTDGQHPPGAGGEARGELRRRFMNGQGGGFGGQGGSSGPAGAGGQGGGLRRSPGGSAGQGRVGGFGGQGGPRGLGGQSGSGGANGQAGLGAGGGAGGQGDQSGNRGFRNSMMERFDTNHNGKIDENEKAQARAYKQQRLEAIERARGGAAPGAGQSAGGSGPPPAPGK